MSERKLASIRRIDKIEPIEGADKIVKATIGGWSLVTAIDNGFKEGDLVVYLEIDSWVPTEIAPFLSKGKEPREFNGVKGERLRTVKLRGQISQGLLLPLSILGFVKLPEGCDGMDVTEILNIQKWEAPIPTQLQGQVRGTFPSWARKTDQERIQNLSKEFEQWKREGLRFECTEKLEGSSMSVYLNDGEFGVCSRNMDLKETEGNTFWQVARKLNLEEKLRELGSNVMLQGELVGPGIQGNIYNLKEHEFRLFDVFDINTHSYMNSHFRAKLGISLGIDHAPMLINIGIENFDTIQDVLNFAEGKSQLADVEREGVVFKCIENPGISFKAISNRYLLGEK